MKIIERIRQYLDKQYFIFKRKLPRFINWIKGIPNYTEAQVELFENLHPGQIVFANMPLTDSEMYYVPEGHDKRPYFIAEKKEDVLLCFYGTTTEPKNRLKDLSFKLNKDLNKIYFFKGEEYIQDNDSYFLTNEIHELKPEHLIEFYHEPDDMHKKHISRITEVSKNSGCDVVLFHYPYEYKKGDIVIYKNKTYYIYSAYKEDIYGYLILLDKNNKIEKVFFEEKEKIDLSFNIDLISFSNEESFKSFEKQIIKKEKKTRTQKQKEKREIIISKQLEKATEIIHKPGTVFEMRFEPSHFIYYYSLDNRHFGVFLEELEYNEYYISEIEQYDLYKKTEVLSSEIANKILDNAINTFNHGNVKYKVKHLINNKHIDIKNLKN